MPPQIHPFSFGDETVNSGDIASVTCLVSKGDLPMNITWTFNGRKMYDNDGIDTGNTKSRSSQLIIDSVEPHHLGEYTCFAQNLLGTAKYSTFLNVNGTLYLFSYYFLLSFSIPALHNYFSLV